MERVVYVNNEFVPASEAKVSVFDRGFTFADSVYEVLPVYKGVPYFVDEHIHRLENSLREVKIVKPKMDWNSLFEELIHRNGGGDLQIYLQISRGNENVRKHDIPSLLTPTIVAYTIHNSYPSRSEKEKGLKAKLVDDVRWARCNIKATALLANVLLNDEAMSDKAHTAILVRDNFITEGSASNVFIVDENSIIKTPPKNNLCLPGITRQITLDLISKLNLAYEEGPVSVAELQKANEVWITSTTKELFPVTQIDNIPVGKGTAGPLWSLLDDEYQQLIKPKND
ncbi:D-alanine-aminotransferase [Legionella adelaidensis]|uniref:Aminodeoxychorismate lyase n=1 Tax=Legionella adelaidensis TaxID=45056 RepID=A0A0W0R497_9GAMM|nr:D-amino acid aminotransferase [Legionella adelaidensis]KTC65877.1 D-alanine-aminotransferase [Legionella adelaidensis]